ncbi:hypothetical protein ND856_07655 [Leptospira bandrabouensis]|uniref:Lipoprotein n=1 Tax=Leptospira bandrabouensis TaxID=2484903 RepID=A0A6H3NIS7_9LEPT|nr:hypothetical protein [Leptospira bandrabouensis]MCW7459731.1 hypothetical protein [Leptospira bandrabouensis]MCW7477156.1 hypothetical protein [Leptospira bandrabouensis]MCW7484838.1 hypothetical protein [Leptospira bandrabouensis]TGN09540.1 hypothetical protein EHR07_00840 [Leptospira bandrabouensis]TGN10722.1 hypothetical protein EHR08_18890 [Leptospira bandrabouensis]
MKKTTSILLALLFVAAVFGNCKEDKKDDTPVLALLLYANDQLSGNCATVTRNSTTSYSVSLSTVPKGGCKVNQTKAEAEASFNTQKTNVLAFFTKAGSVCDTSATFTTNYFNTQITNSNNQTDSAFAATVEKTRAFSVGNLVTESALKLKNTDGRTDAQIAAMSPGSLNDLFFSTAITLAGNVSASCATAVKALDQTTADALTSTPPTKLVSSSCTYGSSAAATTKCATLATEF